MIQLLGAALMPQVNSKSPVARDKHPDSCTHIVNTLTRTHDLGGSKNCFRNCNGMGRKEGKRKLLQELQWDGMGSRFK